MNSPNNIAVLMGGTSAERAVSLNSGQAIYKALRSQNYPVTAIDYQGDPQQLFGLIQFDLVFIALHGPIGEDGTVQGFLDMIGVPYTGSGVLASALSMDKWRSKCLWQQHNLRTPPSIYITEQSDQEIVEALGLPICIKPTTEGSSYGISQVTEAAQLRPAILLAQQYGQVMAEKWIIGKEYTVGIVNNHVLPTICIETPRAFYDYEAKYVVNTTQYHCPSGLAEAQEAQLKILAKQAFSALGCNGWARVDFIIDQNGTFYLIELNTIPGMTETSLLPKAAKQYGWSFSELITQIIGAKTT